MAKEYGDREFLESMPSSALIGALRGKKLSPDDINNLEQILLRSKGGENRLGTGKASTPENKNKPKNNKALIRTIEQGDIVEFSMLLNRSNVDLPDENGTTPLIAAVKNGDVVMIQRVLQLNPNIDAEDNQHETALSYAIKNHDIVTTVHLQQSARRKSKGI